MNCPDEILLPFEPSELEELNEWLHGIISILNVVKRVN
jgi:hypothetical protein